MRPFAIVVQNLIRVLFLVLLVLGFMFWSGHALNLVQWHMHLGELLVAALWLLAVVALVKRVAPVLSIVALLWGLLVVFFGMRMPVLMPGPAHEAIRLIHLLIGVVAIGLAEVIGARVKRSSAATG